MAEINASGSQLLYSTYLGGRWDESGVSVAVNANSEAFITGLTMSADFPLVNPLSSSFGPAETFDAYGTGFVAKIAAGGGSLLFSSFFLSVPSAVTIDSSGAPWLAGDSRIELPLIQPIQASAGNGFVSQLNSSGSAMQFSTFLCGPVASLALAVGGSVWVSGSACYDDFPGISPSTLGPVGYLARIDPAPPAAQPRIPRIDGVYNGGSFEWGNAVAPGEVVTLLGAELASSTQSAAVTPLPNSLGGVSVTVGGMAAPLYYASSGQINFQVPTSLALGAADLAVTRGANVTHRSVNVVPSRPGIFFVNGVPAVTHASDFSLVTATNPAQPGEYLAVFCSGLGATTPSVAAGQISPFAPLQASGFISVGTGAEIYFQYAGLAPGSVGLYQVNFLLPANTVVGLTDLLLSIGFRSTDVPLYVQ